MNDFDPQSPRSMEALKRQGIDPSELAPKSINDIKRANKGVRLDERAW